MAIFITRRTFLKRMFKWAALAGLGYYSYRAGLAGLKEDFRYWGNVVKPKKKPENKLLFDPHGHYRLFNDRADLEAMVDTFFKKTDFVNITAHDPTNVIERERSCNYEEFVEAVKTLDYEVKFSDEYATILNNGRKDLVFFKAQEVVARNPYSKNHEIHVNVWGHDYMPFGLPADDLLETLDNHGASTMINHPFSKPKKVIKFWFPTDKEVRYLRYLTIVHDVFVEEFNSMNTLWMAASNGKAKKFVESLNPKRVGLAGTDAHGSTIANTKKMIGHAGTLLDKDPAIMDFRSYTGLEMIQALTKYMKKNGVDILDNYASPGLFFNVMVRRV